MPDTCSRPDSLADYRRNSSTAMSNNCSYPDSSVDYHNKTRPAMPDNFSHPNSSADCCSIASSPMPDSCSHPDWSVGYQKFLFPILSGRSLTIQSGRGNILMRRRLMKLLKRLMNLKSPILLQVMRQGYRQSGVVFH